MEPRKLGVILCGLAEDMEFRAGLVPVFENTWNTIFRPVWFLFFKTVFCLKNKGNMENTFGSQIFTIQKKLKNTTLNQENKNSFQKTTKWCSLCFQRPFSRIVLKNRNQTGLLF